MLGFCCGRITLQFNCLLRDTGLHLDKEVVHLMG